ncbi:uncharacterized protein [Populus alba]|uniref:uncharacterized protein n=1 Tax=Populus alba TaxID=43335 RepID=UPI00158EFA07|nr:uncharacterized protein LOC118040603 [Populus alba]
MDPDKVRTIRSMPAPKTEKDVRGFLGRLNYIAQFISQLTTTCDPIFCLLRKKNPGIWNEECEEAFKKIKQYLLNPPLFVPPIPERSLILYLTITETSMRCVLGQHNETRRKERVIYYLSKKFTKYEARYTVIEKLRCAFIWATKRLCPYMLYHTTWLISKLDPLRYICEKPYLSSRIARWQVLLAEYDIVYMTRKAVKGSAIADHLANNAMEDYEPLNFDFPVEDVLLVEKEKLDWWTMYFDSVVNVCGNGAGAVIISPDKKQYMVSIKLQFGCINYTAEYEACILGLEAALELNIRKMNVYGDSMLIICQVKGEWQTKEEKLRPYQEYLAKLAGEFEEIEFTHLGKEGNQFVDALATLASMTRIDFGHKAYPMGASKIDKKTLRRLAMDFYLDGEILYKKSSDGTLLRCLDEVEAKNALQEVHEGICLTHASRHIMARKIQRVYGDKINAASAPLFNLTSPWLFAMWGIDVIGPVNPKASNGHGFILVAIDYFTKWVEAGSFAYVTQKVIIQKMVVTYKDWHQMLPFALHVYRTAVQTSTRATPYTLVYGMEVVLPLKVEIPSLRVLMDSELEEAKQAKVRYEQLNLISEKRIAVICHHQLYQRRMAKSYDKKVRPRGFQEGDLVLKKILHLPREVQSKWAPNYDGPYVVKKAFSRGALLLSRMDGEDLVRHVNYDAIKKYYS